MKNTFEDYLQEKHADQYVGLDDDMPDDFNDWLMNLDVDELLDYGEKYGVKIRHEGWKAGWDECKEQVFNNLKK